MQTGASECDKVAKIITRIKDEHEGKIEGFLQLETLLVWVGKAQKGLEKLRGAGKGGVSCFYSGNLHRVSVYYILRAILLNLFSGGRAREASGGQGQGQYWCMLSTHHATPRQRAGAPQLPRAGQEREAGVVPHHVGGGQLPVLQVLPRVLAL